MTGKKMYNKYPMNSRERMNTAMAGGIPDRVPVMCQMSIGHMILHSSSPAPELWLDMETYARTLLQLRERYAFDGILISLFGHNPHWEADIDRRYEEKGEEVIQWKTGDRTVFPRDDLPRFYPKKEKQKPSLENFDISSPAAGIEDIPVSQGLRYPLDKNHIFDIIHDISSSAGSEYSIHGEITSPFDYFIYALGFNQAVTGLFENPEKCRDILQFYTDGLILLAEGLGRCPIDAIKISSPFAGSSFISPQQYREFVLPYEEQIALRVRTLGKFVYLHTCGSIGDRLELMSSSAVDGIECLDPPPLGDVGLAEAKKLVGSRIFIKGNIDPINVLLKKDAPDVALDAQKRLEIGKPGGGFILSSACSIAPYTPPQNIRVLAEAAEKYGRCPGPE